MRTFVSPLHTFATIAVSLALLGAFALPAKAQSLNFSLTPAQRDGLPGQTITFTGILSNTNSFDIFIDNIGATYSDDNSQRYLTVSPSANLPLSIAANSTYTGAIFDVFIDTEAQYGRLFGTAVVYGGTTSGSFNTVASQNFVVVPEVNTAGLMAGAALPVLGAVAIRARRRKMA